MLAFQQSEATAARRRVPVHLVDATDGITPETGEAGGQPQLSKNGAAFANTTATLTAVSNGAYYVELTSTELDTLGMGIVRFKSANTAEFQIAFQIVAYDPFAANLGLNDLSAAQVNTEVDTALADIGLDHLVSAAVAGADVADNSIIAKLAAKAATADWDTYDNTTDSLEAIRDRGDAAWTTGGGGNAVLLQNTTIDTLSSQTQFTLVDGSADDDAYNGMVIVITDSATSTQKAVGIVANYTGASKQVTLEVDPGIFTMAAGDTVDILAIPGDLEIANKVWDESPNGHTTTGTYGAFLQPHHWGSAQAGAATTITLAATASATDDIYNGAIITIYSGTGGEQSRIITDYNGTTKVATVSRAWETNPASGSPYRIDPFDYTVVQTLLAAAIGSGDIDSTALNEIADALLKRDMSAVSGEAARSPLNALRALRNKLSISGTTLTVTKEDDTTSAWTGSVTTDAAADPVTAIDPA